MANTDKTSTMLLDQLAALNPKRRRELAAVLRGVAETFQIRPARAALTHVERRSKTPRTL